MLEPSAVETLESMRMCRAKSASNGRFKPKLDIFYNKAKLLTRRVEQQPSLKTFDLQSVLPVMSQGNGGPELVGVANSLLV